jgi:hypothetical protein
MDTSNGAEPAGNWTRKGRNAFSARTIGGYVYRAEIARARLAARVIRQSARRILDENPSQGTLNLLLARIAAANAENQDALEELERIAATRSPGSSGKERNHA